MVDERKMKTSQRSEERLGLANKLYEANKLLQEVAVIWSKLDSEEFYATGLCYPHYLPSFDEFVKDMDFWLDHMCNEDM